MSSSIRLELISPEIGALRRHGSHTARRAGQPRDRAVGWIRLLLLGDLSAVFLALSDGWGDGREVRGPVPRGRYRASTTPARNSVSERFLHDIEGVAEGTSADSPISVPEAIGYRSSLIVAAY